MRTYFLVVCIATIWFGSTSAWAQNGYIIRVDGDRVYLNLPNVKVTDIVSVYSNDGYMTDPRTGREIRQEPEVVGQIKVIAVQGMYSVGIVYGNSRTHLGEGMTVGKGTVMQRNDYGEATVMIAPAELNFPQGLNTMVDGGYIGDYVSAALMSHLLKSDKIQLVDRSIFGAYQQGGDFGYGSQRGIYEKEMDLINSGVIDPYSSLAYGQMSGVRYIVKITMQKPDVVNVSNNIPVRGIANMASDAANAFRTSRGGTSRTNITQDLLPTNMQTTKIKVSVRIVTHIIDLQTGKVLFMTNGIGTASGKPQIGLEYSGYGNSYDYGSGYDYGNNNMQITLDSKDVNFTQTVTGQAIDDAFKKIGPQLNKYFKENL